MMNRPSSLTYQDRSCKLPMVVRLGYGSKNIWVSRRRIRPFIMSGFRGGAWFVADVPLMKDIEAEE